MIIYDIRKRKFYKHAIIYRIMTKGKFIMDSLVLKRLSDKKSGFNGEIEKIEKQANAIDRLYRNIQNAHEIPDYNNRIMQNNMKIDTGIYMTTRISEIIQKGLLLENISLTKRNTIYL